MSCHLCGEEAVARCFNCGNLMCAKHGKHDNCSACEGGIAAGDPRNDRISAVPMSAASARAGWWRPQQAEEYRPPACTTCGGICRAKCRECGGHYCSKHAGPNGLCKVCGGSSWLGIIILALLAAFWLGVLLWGWLTSDSAKVPVSGLSHTPPLVASFVGKKSRPGGV